jgi:RNA polymerase sigma-70 factor (sigma-E family)
MSAMSVPGEAVPAERATDAGGRDAALAELFRTEYLPAVRLARLLVDRTDVAEELVQEAFARVHRSYDSVEDPVRLPAYLRSAVLNLARSHLRRRTIGRRVLRRHRAGEVGWSGGADEPTLVAAEHREVLSALASLSVRQREVLVLRYWEDRSEAEIAELLDISVGTVKTHAHRGITALARHLEVSYG